MKKNKSPNIDSTDLITKKTNHSNRELFSIVKFEGEKCAYAFLSLFSLSYSHLSERLLPYTLIIMQLHLVGLLFVVFLVVSLFNGITDARSHHLRSGKFPMSHRRLAAHHKRPGQHARLG